LARPNGVMATLVNGKSSMADRNLNFPMAIDHPFIPLL
jgi:hypothetical protein